MKLERFYQFYAKFTNQEAMLTAVDFFSMYFTKRACT